MQLLSNRQHLAVQLPNFIENLLTIIRKSVYSFEFDYFEFDGIYFF